MASTAFYSHRSPLSSLLRARRGRGAGGPLQAFALLHLLSELGKLSWRPPLTLGLMALNAASFFSRGRVLPVIGPWTIPSCGFDGARATLLLRVLAVAMRGQSRRLHWGGTHGTGVALLAGRELVRRMIGSQLLHVDTWHLYYNMTSLLWKGVELESQLGLPHLACLVGWSLLTTPIFALAVSLALASAGYPRSLRTTTVGFSGVLFSLKVVANSNVSRHTVLPFINIVLPSRWATWLELVLIQLLVPNTSLTGHLGGILSGLAYLNLQRVIYGCATRPRSCEGAGHSSSATPRRRSDRTHGAGAAASNTLQSLLRAARQMKRQCHLLARSLQATIPSHRRPRPRFHGSGTTRRTGVAVEVN